MSGSMRLPAVRLRPSVYRTIHHTDTRSRRAMGPHQSTPFGPEVMEWAISLTIVFRHGGP